MIYLAYFTKESGELIWSFRHPMSPTDLIAKIAGKDDVLISGLISAISGFGSETLGDKLQSIDFERVRLYFRYMKLNDQNILVTVISDKEDAPEAIWDTISEFIEKNRKELLDLAEELGLLDAKKYDMINIKLNKSMLKLLDSRKRSISLLAYRNTRTIILGLIPPLIVFIAMFFVTLIIKEQYSLLETRRIGELIATIVFLMFILPSFVMGFSIGYREGTRYGGLGLGAIGLIALSIYYWKALLDWAHGLGLEYYLPFLLAIVIFILGSAMGTIGSFIAWHFVEKKTLVPPKEKEILESLDKVEIYESEAERLLEEFSGEEET